ncbi:MAG: 1,4-alpha-glucan branching enzyme, partial [Planctomycetota bacterium]
MRTQVSLESIGALAEGRHENPFDLLGPHEVTDGGRRALAVRAFQPDSSRVWLADPAGEAVRPMRRIHPSGLYEAIFPLDDAKIGGLAKAGGYRLSVSDDRGGRNTMHDPYAFDPLLTDDDLHLLHEGTHYRSFDRLGAHLREIDGVRGVNFAVWAPNAEGVSVVGDFNGWSQRTHAMRKRGGIWELFVPGLPIGTLYKFAVKQQGGRVAEKCDPYA